MPREHFLVFGAPVIAEDEIAAVVAVLRSGWIGTGPRAKAFRSTSKHVPATQARRVPNRRISPV